MIILTVQMLLEPGANQGVVPAPTKQLVPKALMPSGPSTSGGCVGSSDANTDSKLWVQIGVVDPRTYLLTRPEWVSPAEPLPATPDSDTYRLPAESKVSPRGALRPLITGVTAACAPAPEAPTATTPPKSPTTTNDASGIRRFARIPPSLHDRRPTVTAPQMLHLPTFLCKRCHVD